MQLDAKIVALPRFDEPGQPVPSTAAHDSADCDAQVADLIATDGYSREALLDLVSPRLLPVDAALMSASDAAALVDLLGAAGVTAGTTVAVLAAEGIDASVVTELIPIIGVLPEEGIRALHDRWEIPLVEAAQLLGATASEMRAGGCSPAEIVASDPHQVPRPSPHAPHKWELGAATMAVDQPTGRVAQYLADHAPTAEVFAAGLGALVCDPVEAIAMTAGLHLSAAHLAAVTEQYGLSAIEAAQAFADAGAPTDLSADAFLLSCDTSNETGVGARTLLAVDGRDVGRGLASCVEAAVAATDVALPSPIDRRLGVDLDDADALLAAVPPPDTNWPSDHELETKAVLDTDLNATLYL